MNIVADEAIPLLDYFFADQGNVYRYQPKALQPKHLKEADILLVRSTTTVNARLLSCAPRLKWVGSCVTGIDHLDTAYLSQQQIPFYAAQGCNAQSVVEYVMSCIAALQQDKKLPLSGRAGVIGVGRIGSEVARLLQRIGFQVSLCDPLRAQTSDVIHTPLAKMRDLDFIAVHTPLTYEGVHATYHLMGRSFFEQHTPGCVLLNAGRGEVINERDLLEYGAHLTWCLDVFEHEPQVNMQIVESAYIATPHIAGHSVEGKARGTEMVYNAAAKFFGWPAKSMPIKTLECSLPQESWQEKVLAYTDPRLESQRMKQALATHIKSFTELRATYAKRHEFESVRGLKLDIFRE